MLASVITNRDYLAPVVDAMQLTPYTPVAEVLAPTLQTAYDKGWIDEFNDGMKTADTNRNEDGSYSSSILTESEDTYINYEHGHEIGVDDSQALVREQLYPMMTVAFAKAKLIVNLSRDKYIIDKYMAESAYGGNVDTADHYWNNKTDADFINEIDAWALEMFGDTGAAKELMTLNVDFSLINGMISTDIITGTSKYTRDLQVAPLASKCSYLADAIGIAAVKPVLAYSDVSGIKGTKKFEYMWDKTKAVLSFQNPGASSTWLAKTFARQTNYTKYSNDIKLESYRIESHKKTMCRASDWRGMKFDYSLGYFIKGVRS